MQTCNYKSLIVNDQRLMFSDLTKARRIGGGMRDACGTPGVDGCFRGKFKLTYFLKHYGRRGRAALNDLLLNHVLFFADPGIIKEAVFVAVTGVLEGNKVRLKWMHHSFSTDEKLATYAIDHTVGMDEAVYQEIKQMKSFKQMTQEGLSEAWESFQSSQKLKERNDSDEVLKNKGLGYAAWQRWYSSCCNTILEMADTMSVDLKYPRTPVIFYGEGGFKSTYKGKRASAYIF